MSLKRARFIKYPPDMDIYKPDTVVRPLTTKEKEVLLERLLEHIGGDRLSDLLAEVASEATQGQADSITWD